ncbi:Fic family protein [Albibacterium indicum]|uniref:Fic family protein n=1 Tax=Albibacterium indicum TaxID=2292082 RepID=UPI000E4F499F
MYCSRNTPQVVELLKVFDGIHNRGELQLKLGLTDREHFRKTYLQPAVYNGFVALTIPDKPTSSKQQYVLTELGKQMANR